MSFEHGETRKMKIENSEVIWIKGDAEINVRKGKQILIYEFHVRVEWTAICKDDVAEGSLKYFTPIRYL